MNCEYTVKRLCNCLIIFGATPMGEFARLLKEMPATAVIDLRLAKYLGATIVSGTPDDLAALAALNLPPCEAVQNEINAAIQTGQPALAHWLAHGERGLSSEALAKALFGIPHSAGTDHPRDTSDVNRCVQMLEQTHSAHRLGEARNLSKAWAALVPHWADLSDPLRPESERNQQLRELLTPKAHALSM